MPWMALVRGLEVVMAAVSEARQERDREALGADPERQSTVPGRHEAGRDERA